jgi:hypothetical protein
MQYIQAEKFNSMFLSKVLYNLKPTTNESSHELEEDKLGKDVLTCQKPSGC